MSQQGILPGLPGFLPAKEASGKGDVMASEPAKGESLTSTVSPPPESEPSGLMEAFNPEAFPYVLAMILGTVLLVRLLNKVLSTLSERALKHRLAIKQVSTFLAFGAYAMMTIFSITSLFTLSSEAIFALSGTMAVTVGFALKDVAASFLAGLFIITNKPFQVGDRISFGGFYGEVREIGIRTVRMVTLDDNLVTIPTNKFLTEAVASANAGELDCMVVVKFYISPRADHGRAKEIVQDAVLASKYLYLGKPFTVLLSTLLANEGNVVIELTAKAYVYDARHEKDFASDVTDRVLWAFRHEGIEVPS